MIRTTRILTALVLTLAGAACAPGGGDPKPESPPTATVLVAADATVPGSCTEIAVIVAEDGNDDPQKGPVSPGSCEGALGRLMHLGALHGANAVVLLERGMAISEEVPRDGIYFARGRLLECAGKERPGPETPFAAACGEGSPPAR